MSKFKNANVQPAAGYYFVQGPFVEEMTDSGLHLPKMAGPDGQPLPSSMNESVTATILAAGDTGNGQPLQFQPGDVVLLGILPHGVENEGVEVAFVRSNNVLAKIN
jgi:co-chaperonin GroES (HSP10)